MPSDFSHIPIIDVSELVAGGPSRAPSPSGSARPAARAASSTSSGTAWTRRCRRGCASSAGEFFAQDLETKLRIRMALGGRAWRGYFRVGDELTSGKPDQKEGLYFGAELPRTTPARPRRHAAARPEPVPGRARGLARDGARVHGGARPAWATG